MSLSRGFIRTQGFYRNASLLERRAATEGRPYNYLS
jgi:hypothetical protein